MSTENPFGKLPQEESVGQKALEKDGGIAVDDIDFKSLEEAQRRKDEEDATATAASKAVEVAEKQRRKDLQGRVEPDLERRDEIFGTLDADRRRVDSLNRENIDDLAANSGRIQDFQREKTEGRDKTEGELGRLTAQLDEALSLTEGREEEKILPKIKEIRDGLRGRLLTAQANLKNINELLKQSGDNLEKVEEYREILARVDELNKEVDQMERKSVPC